MSSIVYFNGKFMAEPEARLPLLTHAFHYGTGVFEGIRAYHDPAGGEVLLFRPLDHYERMSRNARLLHMTLPAAPEDLVVETVDGSAAGKSLNTKDTTGTKDS